MQKQAYFINNPSSERIAITELRIELPPGISNLFELNNKLSYEQIEYSVKNGTLSAAIQNGLCYPVPNPDGINIKTFSDDVLIRKPLQVQALPSRARFTAVKNQEAVIFDAVDAAALFGTEEAKPARELEEELKKQIANNTEHIEATIKQANLPDKPIQNRYVVAPVPTAAEDKKIKNDIATGYVTCNGVTANGKQCMRRAKQNSKYCGLHIKQVK